MNIAGRRRHKPETAHLFVIPFRSVIEAFPGPGVPEGEGTSAPRDACGRALLIMQLMAERLISGWYRTTTQTSTETVAATTTRIWTWPRWPRAGRFRFGERLQLRDASTYAGGRQQSPGGSSSLPTASAASRNVCPVAGGKNRRRRFNVRVGNQANLACRGARWKFRGEAAAFFDLDGTLV